MSHKQVLGRKILLTINEIHHGKANRFQVKRREPKETPQYNRPARAVLIGILAISAVLMAACSSSSSSSSTAKTTSSKASIKVAIVAPFSGAESQYGEDAKDAWTMATTQYGDIFDGHKVTIADYNGGCSPAQTDVAVRDALASGAVVTLGPICSDSITATESLYKSAKIPELVTGLAASITEMGNPYVFRVAASTKELDVGVGPLVKSLGLTKVGIIQNSTAYGEEDATDVASSLKSVGITPVLTLAYTSGQTDFASEVARMAASGAQAVYTAGYDVGEADFALQAKQAGDHFVIIGNVGLDSSAAITAAHGATDGGYFSTSFYCSESAAAQSACSTWQSSFHYAMTSDPFTKYVSSVIILEAIKELKGNVTTSNLTHLLKTGRFKVGDLGTYGFKTSGNLTCPPVFEDQLVSPTQIKLIHNYTPSTC